MQECLPSITSTISPVPAYLKTASGEENVQTKFSIGNKNVIAQKATPTKKSNIIAIFLFLGDLRNRFIKKNMVTRKHTLISIRIIPYIKSLSLLLQFYFWVNYFTGCCEGEVYP